MSDMLMDMHQRPTAVTNLNKFKNNNNNTLYEYYEPDTFEPINSTKTPAMRSSSSPQNSTITSDRTTTAVDDAAADAPSADENDEFANLLSLKLRKPKHWRWELSTARSCANIALPRILLYDHKGQLLADVNSQEEQCYSQPQQEEEKEQQRTQQAKSEQSRANGDVVQPRTARKRAAKAATTNLAHSIRKALDRQFSGLQIEEATPSPVNSKSLSAATTPTTGNTPATSLSPAIDFYTNDLPDFEMRRRSSSLKGVRFKVNDKPKFDKHSVSNDCSLPHPFNLADMPTPPSTITTTTTPTNSSSSGPPREKRRYRRSHSSGRSAGGTSESILERFSFTKGRFSSPEYAEEQEVYHPPRYYLRTCKAGTLVLQHESFSRYRRRPQRPRHSSSENLQSATGSGSKNSLKMSNSGRTKTAFTNDGGMVVAAELSCESLTNMSEKQRRKKALPIRRHRSDGNVLLQQYTPSSDDECKKGRI